MSNRIKISLLLGVLLAAAIAVIAYLKLAEPVPLEFDSSQGIIIISPPVQLPDVTLTDQNNTPFPLSRFKGRWNMVFFGYTHCPDVCPTTLAAMNRAAKKLPSSHIGYYFVTLDPQRDTPEKLKEFVTYFNPQFVGLTGDKTNIDRLSKKLGVVYDYEGDVASGEYTVNHYAAILVIDPRGRLRAHILPPHPVKKLVEAMTKITEYYGD
jgi:protein SCO1/2